MITVKLRHPIVLPVDKSILERAASQTLAAASSTADVDISIILGDNAFLHRLNLKYLGIDAPTDVLSFPAGHIDPDTHAVYLGDVIISLTQAESQAATGMHPLADELQLLVVHGVLHLLGYDHETDDDKKRMQAAQDEILDLLAVKVKTTL